MSKPLVSIIVPNYNYARFLKRRIDSILNQTFKDFELILLDDASTDESREIMETYKENPSVTHLIYNESNSGSPFAQWEKGIKLSQGKYIWIAESDDYAEPTFLAETVQLLEKYNQAVVCFSGSHRVDERGKEVNIDYDRWSKKQLNVKCGYKVFDGPKYAQYNMYWRAYIYNASGVVFRREAVEKVDTQHCFSMRSSGDWLFWTELICQGEVIELYKKLNYFRYHSSSTSVQSRRSGNALKEDIAVIKEMEEKLVHVSAYKRLIRRGVFYKKIKRLHIDSEARQRLYEELAQAIGGNRESYIAERINQYLSFIIPFLPTERHERL